MNTETNINVNEEATVEVEATEAKTYSQEEVLALFMSIKILLVEIRVFLHLEG